MTLDTALAITTGEGWAYAAGHVMNPPPAGPDIFVMGVDIDDPQSPWSYAYDGGGGPDFARGIAYGADGNIYVSGVSYLPDSAGTALGVISLTAQGAYRWAYLDTGGRALALNIGGEIAVDPEGNSYVAGMLAGTAQTHMDAAVLSLTSGGTLRWRYTYARPDTGMDMLSSITRGPDGNLYACGLTGDPPSSDWLVVSLSPSGAVNEATGAGVTAHRPTLIVDAMNLAGTGPTTVVLDATGRIVARGELPAARLAALRSGVYFLRSGRDRHKLVKP
jgi:hypothetical protein